MKISIVIPTYNRATLLPRALKSILSQSYTDWEVIVVDDGSTDATQSVMQEYISDKIRYIQQEKNAGVSAARNTGVLAATGDWVSFLDSDDEYRPDALAILAREAEQVPTSIGMLFFQIDLVKEDGTEIGARGYMPGVTWDTYEASYEDLILKRDIRNDMHRTYRTSVIKNYPFDERIKDHDTILYASIAQKGVGCLYVNKTLVNVYVGRNDHLSHGTRDPRAWKYIYSLYLHDHLEVLTRNRTAYSMTCIGMGICCIKLGELGGIVWLIRGFFLDPRAVSALLYKSIIPSGE